jgi:2',3'-cyclic-nucleotide 2'-phosphodiesterase (5'-nucleotidase family)
VKEIRESVKGILVLDAGDLLFKKYYGPILEADVKMTTEKAYVMIDSLNLMGFDGIGIGDDDLSLGKEFLLEIAKRANFPLISSNLIQEESGKLLFKPYIVKEINGLKIGIFSLLSSDLFSNPSDPRRKGLIFRSPLETAQHMVKELQPKTDLIILLSHLGYQKDMELAQTVPGINLIVGSHTGVNLAYAPVIKNTILLQTASKGMLAGRIDLTLYNNEPTFYNTMAKKSLEDKLHFLNLRSGSKEASEADKAQWRKTKEEIERSLQQYHGKNEFTNVIISLSEERKEHPDIVKLVEAFKLTYPEIEKPPTPSILPERRGEIQKK